MILAMLLAALVSFGSLLATLLMGLNVIGGNHILWGIFSVPFGLFTLTLHMFYFIGTGSDIKKILARENVEASIAQPIVWETKLFKKRTFPWLFWAMMLQMATFLLGGAVGGALLPPVLHATFAYLALAATFVALLRSHQMARRTFFLLLRVAELVHKPHAAQPAPPHVAEPSSSDPSSSAPGSSTPGSSTPARRSS